MHIHCLSEKPSILNTFIAEIRDRNIQRDRMRFRRNLERIGEVLSYEMSRSLHYVDTAVETPLGQSPDTLPADDIVVCSILRAGLPMHIGVLNYFDRAENAFISAYRKHIAGSDDFKIMIEYMACPDLENKTLILVDPMLATGQSIYLTYEVLREFGNPKVIHIISAIGSKEGVKNTAERVHPNTHLWIGAIDPELNDKGYIVPGLGDAGDLAFGSKLQQ